VEAGTLVKLNGPSFCGIFEGTKLIIPVERINQDRKNPFLGFEAKGIRYKWGALDRLVEYSGGKSLSFGKKDVAIVNLRHRKSSK
jgi:hypothetical protein